MAIRYSRLYPFSYNVTSWDKLKVNYWAIPKCGNTAVKKSLYINEYGGNATEKTKKSIVLSDKVKEQVYKRYRQDFENFNYNK